MSRPRNERVPRAQVSGRDGRGLLKGGAGDGYVWVNASSLNYGVRVQLDPDSAEAFALALALWARQARAGAEEAR